MILGFGNNITAKLASDITSLQTNIPVDPGSGAIFAKTLTTDISNPDIKHQIIAKVTLSNLQQTVSEICHLTAVDGDTLTVVRGREGTESRGWKLGDLIANFATRGSENNFVQLEQLQGGDYVYSNALGTGNNLVVNLPSTYTTDNWDLKSPIVISPNANNTGNVTIQLILGGMTIGTFPVYKGGKSQLVRDDIIAGIPFILMLDKTKTFFYIINGNYLPLTGGQLSGALGVATDITIGGRLAVRNDQNSDVILETKSGDKNGYTIRRFADDLFIYPSKSGVVGDNYIAKYQKETDTWDFNTAGLTKNGVPIVGDNSFPLEIVATSPDKIRTNGWTKLPNGLIIQWVWKDNQTGSSIKWPVPFTNWVMVSIAGKMQNGNEVSDWNVDSSLTGVSIPIGGRMYFGTIIAIGQ